MSRAEVVDVSLQLVWLAAISAASSVEDISCGNPGAYFPADHAPSSQFMAGIIRGSATTPLRSEADDLSFL